MIKTVIFDLGGVVLNRGLWLFREYLTKNYNVTNQETIDIFIKKYYKPFFSGSMSEDEFWKGSLSDLNITEDPQKMKKKILEFYSLNDDVTEIVSSIKKSGYKTIFLSDQVDNWFEHLDKKYSISNYFDELVISYREGVNKPDKKIYEIALEKSKSKPEECIFIDDLEHNLPPARELGIETILFENANQLKKDLSKFISF